MADESEIPAQVIVGQTRWKNSSVKDKCKSCSAFRIACKWAALQKINTEARSSRQNCKGG